MHPLLILLLCCGEAPVPLPPPVRPEPVDARMVSFPGVSGYLARPLQRVEPGRAMLLLVDAIDPTTQAVAAGEARDGLVALEIGPHVSRDAALAYLNQMPGLQPPAVQRCLRRDGCEARP